MKNYLKLLALITTLAPSLAFAGATRGKQEFSKAPYLLRDQNCLGIGPCTWSFTKDQIAGNDLAVVVVQATAAITVGETPVMTCFARYQLDSVTFARGRLQTCDFSLGVNNCVSTNTTWTKALIVTGNPDDATWTWRVDVTGLEQLECSLRTFQAANRWNVHGILSTY